MHDVPSLSCGQAEVRVAELVTAEARALLDNEQWKERLSGATTMQQQLQAKDALGVLRWVVM